jgi:dTDP-glucose pyrophosphorylase
MKIVIPMAGAGSRFSQAGYALPKPLIDVNGKPMIRRVIENLAFDASYVFIVRDEHLRSYDLEDTLKEATNNNYQLVVTDGLTEGAACTVLLAEEIINVGEDIMISNCDEVMDYEPENFQNLIFADRNHHDFIWVFKDPTRNPKWSYARSEKYMQIVEVAEKNPISEWATCGVYYWRQGYAFVSCAKEMIKKNIRVNGEFYVCPVYNIGIRRGRPVRPFFVNKMWGLGTPEDLEVYLNHDIR